MITQNEVKVSKKVTEMAFIITCPIVKGLLLLIPLQEMVVSLIL